MKKVLITSPQTQRAVEWMVAHRGTDIMDYAKQKGWDDVRICGQGKMITSPLTHDSGWTLAPYEDTLIIPTEARKRLNELDRAGITYQGLLIAHEPETEIEPPEEQGDLFNKKWLLYAGIGTAAVLLLPVMAVAAGVVLICGAASLVLGAIGYVALNDPTLIVVCSDGTWIELYKWYA